MAINASTAWEVRTDGNDTNGGGYSSAVAGAGTDYSQQASAQLSVSDGACSGTTTLVSVTGGFTSAMVGNCVYLSSGPGWYQITGYTDTNTVAIDRAGPSASGMTVNVGGALATPGRLSNLPASGNRCWIKSGTYTITTSTPGPSGPYYQSSNIAVVLEGYQTTRGDEGQSPVLSAGSVGSVTLWRMACTNQRSHFRNLTADANGQSAVYGFQYNGAQLRAPYLCKAIDCVGGFFFTGSVSCFTDNCVSGFVSRDHYYSYASGSTNYGFSANLAVNCIASGCATGFGNLDFALGVHSACLAYNCTAGFYQDIGAVSRRLNLMYCLAHTCTNGFETQYSTSDLAYSSYERCAHYNCTNGSLGSAEWHDVTALARDPLTNAAGGDFTLNTDGATELTGTPWLDQLWIHTIGAVRNVSGGGGAPATHHPLKSRALGGG